MRFGVREICDVVFKAKANVMIGAKTFKKGQPVLYIDSAKTSSLENAATTVYATGGKGNSRLVAWEGEKTVTFTVEDALLSPIGLAVLSGAGLLKGSDTETVHVHTTAYAWVDEFGAIDLSHVLEDTETIDAEAPIFILGLDADGNSFTGDTITGGTPGTQEITGLTTYANQQVFVDFYITKASNSVSELQIDASSFGGFYYVEASTLFRNESTGVDMPAEITFPKVKIQSNFTFTMASTGDPSTFTFTMDAFPDYTVFNKKKKVICVIQIVEDAVSGAEQRQSVMAHADGEAFSEIEDSVSDAAAAGELYDVTFAENDTITVAGGTENIKIHENGLKSFKITANTGYTLPNDFSVTGANHIWDKDAGLLTIGAPTGDVSIAVKE